MGLALSVGAFAGYLESGENEGAEWFLRHLREINRLLAAEGLPAHVEPHRLPKLRNCCSLAGMPYSWIHYVRRAYAYAMHAPAEFAPLAEGADTDDAYLNREESLLRSHLVCHSDCEGFYAPVDFREPLYDEENALTGEILGSSQGAMRELVQTAPLLNIRLRKSELSDTVAREINNEDDGPLYIERQVWLQLYEVFRLSIEHNSLVMFC
jgi:hypothetical protein